MNEKTCTKCHQTKLVDAFGIVSVAGKTKIRSRCRQCLNDDTQLYRHKYPEKCRLAARTRKRMMHQRHPALTMYYAAKQRARRKGLAFNLTREDIRIPERCPVFGYPLRVNEQQFAYDSCSLDRIVPELGYVRGNVRVISWRANRVRGDATLNELKRLVQWLEEQEQ